MNYSGPDREGEREKKTGKEAHIASKLEQIVRNREVVVRRSFGSHH
jgi:hypothetical protein